MPYPKYCFLTAESLHLDDLHQDFQELDQQTCLSSLQFFLESSASVFDSLGYHHKKFKKIIEFNIGHFYRFF